MFVHIGGGFIGEKTPRMFEFGQNKVGEKTLEFFKRFLTNKAPTIVVKGVYNAVTLIVTAYGLSLPWISRQR